jgi:hypothetical protein
MVEAGCQLNESESEDDEDESEDEELLYEGEDGAEQDASESGDNG